MGILLLLVPGALTPVSASGSRIAIMAHAAGFVAGFLSGYAFERRVAPDRLERIGKRSDRALVVVSVFVLCAFLSAAGTVAGR
jgi:membrane associated rhomboid family serine protease